MLSDIFYNIDPSTMILALLFVIFFAVIQLALGKTLKDKGTSGIVAFCVSLLAVYGISRTNLDVSGIFYKIGINDSMIYTIIPFLIIAGLVFIIWKMGLAKTLMLIGTVFIIGSFFVYQKNLLLIIGIALLAIGFFLWMRKKRKERREWSRAPKVKNKLYII